MKISFSFASFNEDVPVTEALKSIQEEININNGIPTGTLQVYEDNSKKIELYDESGNPITLCTGTILQPYITKKKIVHNMHYIIKSFNEAQPFETVLSNLLSTNNVKFLTPPTKINSSFSIIPSLYDSNYIEKRFNGIVTIAAEY